jgi:hypothetical protein
VDPIQPISPRIPGAGRVPVERLERVSRERDRPARERPDGRRRPPPPGESQRPDGEEGEGRHIDVRV